jgi:hypothetical protein
MSRGRWSINAFDLLSIFFDYCIWLVSCFRLCLPLRTGIRVCLLVWGLDINRDLTFLTKKSFRNSYRTPFVCKNQIILGQINFLTGLTNNLCNHRLLILCGCIFQSIFTVLIAIIGLDWRRRLVPVSSWFGNWPLLLCILNLNLNVVWRVLA